MNSIHETHRTVGQEADRYGHLTNTSTAKTIEQTRISEPSEVDTKVGHCGLEFHLTRILVPTDRTGSRKALNYALHVTKPSRSRVDSTAFL